MLETIWRNARVSFVSLVMLCAILTPQGYAATKYDSGKSPSVVKVGNTIIEVHQSENFGTLWYKIGTLDKNTVKWGASYKYGTGTSPSIAMIGNTLIETHQSHEKSKSEFDQTPLYYSVGTLSADKKTITWGNALMYYEDGIKPSVSISENNVITMHQVPHLYHIDATPIYDDDGQIIGHKYAYFYYYTLQHLVGILDNNTRIKWFDSGTYDLAIQHSAIASAGDVVIEAHQDETNQTLWYRVGIIHDNRIEWGISTHYALGATPSISISGNTIVSRHNCFNSYKLCYGVGVVDKDSKTIDWGNTDLVDDAGIYPSIVLDGKTIVETHKSESFNSLYFNLGIINSDAKTINWGTASINLSLPQ